MRQRIARHITSNDVAKAAKVSRVTVSRVLNNHGNVTEAVRQRVLAAARELGYHAAQSRALLHEHHPFADTNSPTLTDLAFFYYSFVDPEAAASHPFWSLILHGAEQEAARAGMNVVYRSMSSLVRNTEMVQAFIKQMRPSGMLLVGEAEADTVRAMLQTGMPIVLVESSVPELEVDAVIVDTMAGIHLAMQHLFARGHRQIAYIGSVLGSVAGTITGGSMTSAPTPFPRIASSISSLERRMTSYFMSLLAAGLPIEYGRVATGKLSFEGGYQSAINLLQRQIPFTAVVCANDEMAIGAMQAFQEHGLRIPDDVSIIGFDDIESTRYIRPALTTIHVDYESLGAVATRALLARIQDPQAAFITMMLKVHLIERESVARRA